MESPNCYKCVHKGSIPGDAHICCNNHEATVRGDEVGIRNGWFLWPLNFDPTWLISCDGFSDDPKDRKPEKEIDPLLRIFSMLK